MPIVQWGLPAWTLRIWCIDEGYETVEAGALLSIGLTEEEEQNFIETLLKDPLEVISKLAVFDIRNATAFNPDDIEKIFALIRAMPGNGFVTINSQIKGQCAWLAGASRLRLPQFLLQTTSDALASLACLLCVSPLGSPRLGRRDGAGRGGAGAHGARGGPHGARLPPAAVGLPPAGRDAAGARGPRALRRGPAAGRRAGGREG